MIYKLIKNSDSEKFNKEVNEMLANEWVLYGFPFVETYTPEIPYISSSYCQAFTRETPLPEPEQQEIVQVEEDLEELAF